ncbi:recombinase family protein [Amycolatopsis pigmentata]|uniref:Recombinase family protein n=1 Tax=Amycolatopsis pigmentata TaxID=450801 RepID=A0ABW5G4Q2_9PSEU
MTRALIYCRISSDPTGRAAGVQRQEGECRELVERNGWDVAEILVDNDISAASGKKRPAYERLIEMIRTDQADAIVAWHTDRLYRRSRDLAQLIDIANEHKIEIRTVTSGDIDLSTASGRMMARVVAAVNEHEIEHGQERMRLAKADAAARGVYRGSSRPFGYERDGMTIREAEAKEIRDATRRVLEGESLGTIMRDWIDRGVPTSKGGTWARPAIRSVLTRARNAGLIEHKGEIVGPAQWPAIVSEHEWRAVRIILLDPARNTYPGTRSRVWLGSGLYLCGICDDGTTVRVGTTGGQRPASAYRCRTEKHLHRTAEPVDEYVEITFVTYLDALRAKGWQPERPDDETTAELQAKVQSIRIELEQLRTALGKREIDLRTFSTTSAQWSAELEETEERLRARLTATPLAVLMDAPDIEEAWGGLPLGSRRAILDMAVAVTLIGARPGRKKGGLYFDPDSILIEPKPGYGLG